MQWHAQAASPHRNGFHTSSDAFVGVIIPGQNVRYDFTPMDGNRWTMHLGNAADTFVVFLMPSSPLPNGYGLSIYLAQAGDLSSFVFLGALKPTHTSSLFRVPAMFLDSLAPVQIVLGISLEKMEDIENLGQTRQQPLQQAHAATRLALAERVLESFYNFVSSYAQCVRPAEGGWQRVAQETAGQSTEQEYVVIPASFVAKWRDRVSTQLQKDSSLLQ